MKKADGKALALECILISFVIRGVDSEQARGYSVIPWADAFRVCIGNWRLWAS
jgi:hypothetical protein